MVGDQGTSLGEEVLGSLLELSHRLQPDDLPQAVADHAARLGAVDAIVYLVDYEQRVLVPLRLREGHAGDPLDIDSTLAGRSFRSQEVIHGEAAGGNRRLWLPLLDGAERLGVLSVSLPVVDPVSERRFR